MAARAAHRQAEPHGRGRVHAIHDILGRILLRDDAALGVATVVAVEAGGDVLFARRAGQQITRELLHREAVEGQVAVERVDHPVAPAPHGAFAVALVAVGVGVAGRVEPTAGHALAVTVGG